MDRPEHQKHQWINNRYFKWLCQQVFATRKTDPSRTYWNLMRQLFQKDFIYIIGNDENRAIDGKDLRKRFLQERRRDIRVGPSWYDDPRCNMLELLIAIADRLEYETKRDSRWWFWHLMENLELDNYNDESSLPVARIDKILDTVIWRIYEEDGTGGLFPLNRPHEDQRDVELWYQICAYLMEHESVLFG